EFFCFLVAFEDIIFIVLGPRYRQGIEIFPIMLLVPIFLIISETTVYGISIAKKPIYDTIGIGISVVSNIGFCWLLAPRYELYGVCLALSLSNILMFLFRTFVAQRFYPSIPSVKRTALVLCLMLLLTGAATLWAHNFALKLLASVVCAAAYFIIYKQQLKNALSMAQDLLKDFKAR
ncbi:MAG: polysaccharide biosynthesis C-terminal domain-containing protein, partial [Oscillospiraceae bacterium]